MDNDRASRISVIERRLNRLYHSAMEAGDCETALEAVQIYNALFGLYENANTIDGGTKRTYERQKSG